MVPNEFFFLIAVLWLPLFIAAACLQWRVIPPSGFRLPLVAALFITQFILAFAIWLSPLHRFFPSLNFLGTFIEFGSIPLQAGILSAVITTGFGYWLNRPAT